MQLQFALCITDRCIPQGRGTIEALSLTEAYVCLTKIWPGEAREARRSSTHSAVEAGGHPLPIPAFPTTLVTFGVSTTVPHDFSKPPAAPGIPDIN